MFRLRSEFTITDAPSFNGFSVRVLELNTIFWGSKNITVAISNVHTLRKVQLYPLQDMEPIRPNPLSANAVTLYKVDCRQCATGRYVFWYDAKFQMRQLPAMHLLNNTLPKSKPVEIVVKPLPDETNLPTFQRSLLGNFNHNHRCKKIVLQTGRCRKFENCNKWRRKYSVNKCPKIN